MPKQREYFYQKYLEFLGINNVVDRTRGIPLKQATFLKVGTNVDCDRSYMLHRRSGYSLSKLGNYKYLWSDGINSYGIKGNDLVMLDKYFNETIIDAGIGDYEVDFVKVATSIYYTNGIKIGHIDNGIVYPLQDPQLVFRQIMPSGDIVRLFNGRLLVARENELFFSVGGGGYDYRDERVSQIGFSENIDMMECVEDGVFISADNIYLLAGLQPEEFESIVKANYKAIKGTATVVYDLTYRGTNSLAPPITFPIAVVWVSEEGICIGSNEKFFRNITKENYRMPASMLKGTSIVRDFMGDKQLISIVQY